MGAPTLWQHARQVLGRALRETGQALDRLGVKTAALAVTPHDYYDDPVLFEDHLSRHRHQFPFLTAGRPVVHPHAAYLAPCATLTGSVFVGRGASIWYGAVVRGDTCENAEAFTRMYALEQDRTGDARLESPLHAASNSSSSSPTAASAPESVSNPAVFDDAEAAAASTPPMEVAWELPEHRRRDQTSHHGGAVYIGNDTNLQDGAIVTAREHHCRIGVGVTIGHLAQLHSCTVHDYCLIGMGSVLNPGVVVETEALVAAGAVVPPDTVIRAGELWVGNPARKVRALDAAQRQRLHHQSREYVKVAATHRPVMQLGGNLHPATGLAVHTIRECRDADDDEAQLYPLVGTAADPARQPLLAVPAKRLSRFNRWQR